MVALIRLAPYALTAGLVVALGFGWGGSTQQAYQRGYDAAQAAQRAVDADTVRSVLEDYNDATGIPIDGAVADCILRQLAGDGNGENCGDLFGVGAGPN